MCVIVNVAFSSRSGVKGYRFSQKPLKKFVPLTPKSLNTGAVFARIPHIHGRYFVFSSPSLFSSAIWVSDLVVDFCQITSSFHALKLNEWFCWNPQFRLFALLGWLLQWWVWHQGLQFGVFWFWESESNQRV